MTANPLGVNHLTRWAGRKPVCVKCGGQVARPKEINGQLRGDCQKCGRTDVEWVER